MRLKNSLALALTLPLAAAGTANAAVGSERTDGANYDRTPSVVQDGALTDLFFVRSQSPCNRLAGCPNADNLDYDLYLKLLNDAAYTGPLILHSLTEAEVDPAIAFLRNKLSASNHAV